MQRNKPLRYKTTKGLKSAKAYVLAVFFSQKDLINAMKVTVYYSFYSSMHTFSFKFSRVVVYRHSRFDKWKLIWLFGYYVDKLLEMLI